MQLSAEGYSKFFIESANYTFELRIDFRVGQRKLWMAENKMERITDFIRTDLFV